MIKDMNVAIANLNRWVGINRSKTSLGNINLENNDNIAAFLICLSPSDVNQLSGASIWESSKIHQMLVKENKIEYLFYKFIIESKGMRYLAKNTSTSSLNSIKKIIKGAL